MILTDNTGRPIEGVVITKVGWSRWLINSHAGRFTRDRCEFQLHEETQSVGAVDPLVGRVTE